MSDAREEARRLTLRKFACYLVGEPAINRLEEHGIKIVPEFFPPPAEQSFQIFPGTPSRRMGFKEYYKALPPEGKKRLAERLETSLAYLSQLATGHRQAGAKILLLIEGATDGNVSPREMRKRGSRDAQCRA